MRGNFVIYMGEWKNNKKNGYGEFIIGDKLYIGYFTMDEKDGFGMNYSQKDDKLYIGFWKNNKRNGFGKIVFGNKIKYGVWDNEKKIEGFNNDEEAFNYLENNNLESYRKIFEYSKEELIKYFDNFFNNEIFSPCELSQI